MQAIQIRPETALAISDTALDGLKSLTLRLGNPKAFRNQDSLRLSLRQCGEPADVRLALQAIIDGPSRASTLDFAEELSRLALHYWRPDFTPKEAAKLNADYLEDLRGITVGELMAACKEWRRNADNRFYPTSGQMFALVKDYLTDRARAASGAEYLLELLAEEKPAGDAADRTARLKALGDAMRVKAGVPQSVATETEKPAFPSTARPVTDAAELIEHIHRKTA